MTRDDVIKIAVEAGCNTLSIPGVGTLLRYNEMRVTNLIERVAELAYAAGAAAEREVMRWHRHNGPHVPAREQEAAA